PLLCLLSVLTASIVADGDFLQPWTAGRNKDYSDNLNHAVGTRITFRWFADFSKASIDLVQDNRPESYNETTWNWEVSYAGLDPTFNNVFYLSVGPEDGNSDSFTSHYFNISAESTTSSATAAAASSSLVSSASPGSTPLQSPPPPSATVTVTPATTDNKGTRPGTIAGAAIGAAVGTFLLAGGAWWAWKSKKKPSSESMVGAQQQVPPNLHLGSYTEPKPYEVDGNELAYEVDRNELQELQETASGQMSELHATERRRMFELEGSGRRARF
ncbi:MAG: hypothetical protein Q9192_008107, partial [Flavoplaca navasiana]